MRVHYATCGSDADSRIRELVEQAHEPGLFDRPNLVELGYTYVPDRRQLRRS